MLEKEPTHRWLLLKRKAEVSEVLLFHYDSSRFAMFPDARFCLLKVLRIRCLAVLHTASVLTVADYSSSRLHGDSFFRIMTVDGTKTVTGMC